ncbi:MAG: phosphoglycerate mutase [Omnitrophica WOR_2 bacterium GWF2_43_52]|nr:MAG: phosphoglycerate mutase [Omnitrophica WOR_2 bacterium GWA2_44_7]OGX17921.1 MAG: phosphoglycerate mutase [Omnitrophica WOR_2 bacterium GWC2_44_8]OGX22753.1 MAG: phosphoglycerate mutase [Omnitrophica WOR_2 bacterium GWF2_43_52]HAH19569.1 phosphoglycerate mutase [Candidatus Omnitrophota bacterium]HBG64383.1 phosphoglycerate mutase [Candidatus Omnitrophota bacterium]
MRKILYVVLDGLGDLPIKELGDKTPLEAAFTPNMDKLAQKGKTGIVYPVAKGIAPESDVAVICLLGYDAHKYYTGRGPLESYAEGLEIHDGDLALRVNFGTVDKDGKTILDRRVGRNLTTEEATELAKEINSKVILSGGTFEFRNTIGHRGVLVIRGQRGRLSGWITNTDPAYGREGVFGIALEKFPNTIQESRPVEGHENDPKAIEAAKLLNEFTQKAHQVLEKAHTNKKRASEGKMVGNAIVSRDAGDCLPKFPSFKDSQGLRFGSFVQMPVEKGIALLTGIDVVELPLSTGKPETDYPLWSETAVKKIKDFDGLYIHIKGPDEPAHDGNFNKKKESIEAIDKFFFGSLIPKINLQDYIIAVTADHSTPCKLKSHSADPVPLLVVGGTIKPDGSLSFSEKAAKLGSIGELTGQDILPFIVKHASQ